MRVLFLDILADNPETLRTIEQAAYLGRPYWTRMRRALGLTEKEFVVCSPYKNTPFPSLSKFDALVIGGSTEDPVVGSKTKPWMKKTYGFIRRATKTSIPILGVCGGLQFTINALGGTIVENPRGRNIGTTRVQKTRVGKQDSFLQGIADIFTVQATHKCIVGRLPKEARVLAKEPRSPFAVVAIGPRIRLTQFHPEMTAGIVRRLACARRKTLKEEGLLKNGWEAFARSICDPSRDGEKMLQNFMKYFVSIDNLPSS